MAMNMKNITRILSIIIITIATMGSTSCRELALNGDLDAQWQVMTLDYPDGTQSAPGQYYYCFYRHTANLTTPGLYPITANLTYDGDDLTLEFPYVSSPTQLAPWGITVPDDATKPQGGWIIHYTVNHLSSKKLVMTTDLGITITCRKF